MIGLNAAWNFANFRGGLIRALVAAGFPVTGWSRGEGPADGTIVAAFAITSHFDIRRQYNPATGEESNVVEENQSDRTWDQREFMRVDWSQNESSGAYDFDTLSMMGLFGGIHYEPLAYHVTDPADPNVPTFNLEDGYFDVTNKAFAKPGLVDLSAFGWGVDSGHRSVRTVPTVNAPAIT